LAPIKAGKNGVVNVDHSVGITRHEFRRQNAHVFREHDVFRRVAGQDIPDQIFMRRPFEILMADVVKWDAECFNQRLEFFMIADYRANHRRQLAGIMPNQQIAEAVGLAGRHDDNGLALGRHKFHDGIFRQNLLEIRNHPIRRRRPLKRSPHKKMFGVEIDKFLVAQNIIAGVIRARR
jgi:hypothetical protein